MSKPLNVGMIGYGFMGRAHSNAYRKVGNFFDLEYQPVLKAACARTEEKAKAFADRWGYESFETDWRKLVERSDIDAIDICVPNNLHREIGPRRRCCGKDDPVRETTGAERRRGRRDGPGGCGRRRAQYGLVQLPPSPGRYAGKTAD